MTRDRSSPREQPESPPNGDEPSRLSWATTVVIRVATQLAGVILAINEAVIRETTRNSVMLLIAIFVLGAQRAEKVLMRAVDHLFGAGNGSNR